MRVSYLFSKLIKKLHIPAIHKSEISARARVCPGAHIVASKIFDYSYVGNYSTVLYCNIGKFCSIGDNCEIGGGSHPTDRVSTSPAFYSGKNILRKNFSKKEYAEFAQTNIGNDVWIGSKCLIKGGITVGDGAIIGMGSVVTHDVPPYEIWAGNPAKCIKKRFDGETANRLLESKWWDFNDKKLSDLGEYFDDVRKFLNEIEKQDKDGI